MKLGWRAALAIAAVALVVGAVCTGCSGISENDWDDLQAKHAEAITHIDAAEAERALIEEDLRKARALIVRLKGLLLEAAEFIRSRGGGMVPGW